MRRDDAESQEPEKLGRGVCEEERMMAVRVVLGGVHYWIPKSVLHDDSEVFQNGHVGEVIVKHWWAEKEGWV